MPDGRTRREHLEAAAAQGAAGAIAELEIPPLPDVAAHVLEWFTEISARRGGGGFGPAPIAYADLAAWSAWHGVRPLAHEVDWLFELDRLFLAAAAPPPPDAKKGKRP